MRIDRRQFNNIVASMAATSLMSGGVSSAFAAESDNSLSKKFLNRLTYGASPASIAEFEAMGKVAWLDQQLTPKTDAELEKRLTSARLGIEYEAGEEEGPDDGVDRTWSARNEDIPYLYLNTKGKDLLHLVDFENTFVDWEERVRPSREVQAAAFLRATHAKAQLREVMTQFWHDHFNVNSQAHEVTAAYFAQYDKIMRSHALGNFRQMLGEMTKSPAMLFYLNNEVSEASPANENFARELLELHTLGAPHYVNGEYESWRDVPGAVDGLAVGYLDEDVYEVARAFTGWTFGDGRWLAEGSDAPRTGEFYYVDSWHDPYQKRILGHELPPNAGPMEDGETVLDLLARHPGTAKYVCTKICRRLLMDHPPQDLVNIAADVFLANNDAPDQMAKVVRAIVLSDVFDATPARKLKRPFEFLISIYRMAGVEVASPSAALAYGLQKTGWTQHAFRPPTGHSDLSEDWANTSALTGMVDVALYGIGAEFTGVQMDYAGVMGPNVTTWGAALEFWFSRFDGIDNPKEAARMLLAETDTDVDAPITADPDELNWIMGMVVGLSALTPGFLFR